MTQHDHGNIWALLLVLVVAVIFIAFIAGQIYEQKDTGTYECVEWKNVCQYTCEGNPNQSVYSYDANSFVECGLEYTNKFIRERWVWGDCIKEGKLTFEKSCTKYTKTYTPEEVAE